LGLFKHPGEHWFWREQSTGITEIQIRLPDKDSQGKNYIFIMEKQQGLHIPCCLFSEKVS